MEDGKVVKVTGMQEHVWNEGRLCPKGAGIMNWINSPDRVLYPQKRDNGFTAGEMEYVISQSDSKVLIFQKEYLDVVRSMQERMKGVEHLVLVDEDEPPAGMLSYERLMDQAAMDPPM